MRFKRAIVGLATVAVAVLGLGLATAGSASAAQLQGSWKAFGNTNPITSSSSKWLCGTTSHIGGGSTAIAAQGCAVRSADGDEVQSAVIVRNDTANSILVDAAGDLRGSDHVELNDWVCAVSGMAPHSWSVCFGQTQSFVPVVQSEGIANGVMLGVSPFV